MPTAPYVAIDLCRTAPPTNQDFYFITFVDAPPRFRFLLDKTPRFTSKADAFRALRHYEFEFDVHGHVCSKFGLEPDPATTQPRAEISDEEDEAQ